MSADARPLDHDSGKDGLGDVGDSGSPIPKVAPILGQSSIETLASPTAQLPTRIGQFHIKSVIASGGMGTVYEAVQDHPRRTVAVKVLKRGIASPSAMRRFEYESQTLARLRHPGIAQVYEAGTYDDGAGVVPYFAMEYIPHALPITTYAREKALTTRQKLELFAHVCDAVHHGHQKGIIHRDLKPGNILVDSHGDVKVIDFGVARGTDSDMAVTTLQTDIGQLIGTLQYMSPEQCVADPHDIDTRSDVYALGVVLYELLSGKPPYDVSKKPVLESTRVIREEQPTRLSTVDVTLRGDTDTIVFKALEKDRERRYQSAVELAQDIRRHLAGEAIVARPPSIVYQLRVFARRNKAFFTAVAAAFVVLMAGVIVSTSLYVQAERQRERAVIAERDQSRERQRAEQALADTEAARKEGEESRLAETEQRRLAESERDRAVAAETLAEEQRNVALDAKHEARRLAYYANIAAAQAALSTNEIATVRRRLDAAPEEFRNWEWHYMYAESDSSLAVLRGHEEGVRSLAFSPDGTRLASASSDKTVRLWDVTSGVELAVLRGHDKRVGPVRFSPDGTRLASASEDATVRMWDTSSGKELAVLRGHHGAVWVLAFSPDGTRVASGSDDDTVRMWDADTGKPLGVLKGHDNDVSELCYSPDGLRLASGSLDNTIRVWDAGTGEALTVLRGHQDDIHALQFSPDGTRLASASDDKTVRLWNVGTGEELAVLKGHDREVWDVTFSPDGSRLASASNDRTVRLWDVSTGREVAVLTGHEDSVWSVAFNPDGTRLASGSFDKTVRLWDTGTGKTVAILRGHERPVFSVAFTPDGTRLASASADKTLRLWAVERHTPLNVLRGHESYLWSVAFSRDGTRVASGGGDEGVTADNSLRLWDPATGEELAVLRGHDHGIWGLAFSPDGALVASASDDGTARVLDVATGEELVVFRGHEDQVLSVAFSPDGTHIATGSFDKTVRLWEVATGKELAILRGHQDLVWGVAISPDGSRLASGSHNKEKAVRLWNTSTGEQLGILKGHEMAIDSVAFSPDGTRLASGSWDNTIRLWDTATGEELRILRGHEGGVCCVTFNRDGTRLASSSYDSTVRLWDASTGEELIALRGHERMVGSVAFSADVTRLVSAAADKTVRIWDTVPFRIRREERLAILAARPEAERIVDELWQQPIDAKSIAERLHDDSSLSDIQRRAALNLLLTRSAQLQERVNALYARLVFTDDVVAALEADDSLASGARFKAVGIARRKGDRPFRVNRDSRNLVRAPGGEPEPYRLGLRGAEAAVAAEPENLDFLNTLGMAQYRNGRYEDAHTTLTRGEELRRQRGVKSVPRGVAVLAMALFKLRRMEDAQAAFERLEEIKNDPEDGWRYDDDVSRGLFDECKQLLEGSNAQPKSPKNPEEGEK